MRFNSHQNAAPLYAPATRSPPMAPTAFASLPNQQAGHRDGAVETWVISLKRSTLLRAEFARRAPPGLDWRLFDGFDGHAPETRDIAHRALAPELFAIRPRIMPGVFGCILSHFQLWRCIAKPGHPVMVQEDDAEFTDPSLIRPDMDGSDRDLRFINARMVRWRQKGAIRWASHAARPDAAGADAAAPSARRAGNQWLSAAAGRGAGVDRGGHALWLQGGCRVIHAGPQRAARTAAALPLSDRPPVSDWICAAWLRPKP